MNDAHTQKAALSLLKNVLVISLSETSLWTGRAKMTAADFGLDAANLPPEAVASLGSKRLISKESLKPLAQIRYLMRRACLEVGTHFLNGFAIAADEAEKVIKKLNTLVAEGNSRREVFLANFDHGIRDWHNENPQWRHILSAGTPAKESIAKRIQFGYQAYLVTAPNNALVAANLVSAAEGLSSSLVDDIVGEAKIFVERSLISGRDQGSQRTLEPMRRLQRKIESLSFVDPALPHLSQVLSKILAGMPEKGKIEGDRFLNLARVGHLMSDGQRFMRISREIHEGKRTVDDVVQEITGEQPQSGGVQAFEFDEPVATPSVPLTSDESGVFSESFADEFCVEAAAALDEIFSTTKVPANAAVTNTAQTVWVDF